MKTKAEPVATIQLLEFARKHAKKVKTADELHNLVFGNDGQMSKLFPDPGARAKFSKSPEFAEIGKLIDSLPQEKPSEASGRFVLRLPQSVHQALIAEAERERVSLNTLCIAKLTARLNTIVR